MPSAVLSKALAWIGLFALLCSTAPGCRKSTVTVRLSRDDIQRRIEPAFPVSQEILLSRVVFEHPKVILNSGSDRIGIGLDVRVEVPVLGPRSGSVTVSGGLDYRRERKAFFLRDAKLDQAEVAGLSAAELAPIRGSLESVAKGALTVLPIYELEGRNAGESAAERVLRRVWVKDGYVYAELGLPTSK